MCVNAWKRKCGLMPADKDRDIKEIGRPPRISVILPVYNAGRYLRQCLSSITGQTLREIEIICVDDGSTDDSGALLAECASHDDRVTIISQSNQGAAVARNTGIDRATGDWLLIFDSDDVLCEKALETAVVQGEADHADVVLFGHRVFYDSMPCPVLGGICCWRKTGRESDVFRLARGWAWDKLWRRQFVRQGGFKFQPLPIANDLFFTYSALAAAETISVTDTPFAAHRMRSGSIETTRDRWPLAPIEAVRALHAEIGVSRGFGRWMPDFLFWHANRMKSRADSRALVCAARQLRRELGVKLSGKWLWEELKHFVRVLLGKAGST